MLQRGHNLQSWLCLKLIPSFYSNHGWKNWIPERQHGSAAIPFQCSLEVLQPKTPSGPKSIFPHLTPTQDKMTFDLKWGYCRVLSFPQKIKRPENYQKTVVSACSDWLIHPYVSWELQRWNDLHDLWSHIMLRPKLYSAYALVKQIH